MGNNHPVVVLAICGLIAITSALSECVEFVDDEEPIDTQSPTTNLPDVEMKFRAKVGFSYESVTMEYRSAWKQLGRVSVVHGLPPVELPGN